SSGVRSPKATTWMWRGSIHAVSALAVSPRPAPSTPETMTSTGPRRVLDSSNCASSSDSRRRGSSRAYTSFATRWPISADSSIVGSGSVPERLGLGELPPGLGQAFQLARAHCRGPAANDARRTRKLGVIARGCQELVDQTRRGDHIVQVSERALQAGQRVDVVFGASMTKQRRQKLGGVTQFFRGDPHLVAARGVRFPKALATFAQSPLGLVECIAGEGGCRGPGGGKLELDTKPSEREQRTGEALRSCFGLRCRAMKPALRRCAQAQAMKAAPLIAVQVRRDLGQCVSEDVPITRRT